MKRVNDLVRKGLAGGVISYEVRGMMEDATTLEVEVFLNQDELDYLLGGEDEAGST